jgi:cephalosporin-C deacetylase-like acetyl esterase
MFELENYIKKYKTSYKTSCFAEDAEFDFPVGYENLNAIYYSVGQCKVFAYIGIPKTEKPKNGYPAIILVHGGDGCAYYEWVKKWTDKGYVAIAPDFDANYATDPSNRRVANSLGGPKGYGSFKQLESEHPWTFFSVLSILNALDLLNAKQSVDKDKISICGLSWGGVLSLFALAVDHRFKSAIIIYSSAYVLDTEFFMDCFKGAGLTDEDKQKYTEVFV